MKKWFVVLLLIGVMTTILVPAFAASKGLTADQKKDISKLEQQIIGLRSQIIDKYVDAGVITKQQGDETKQRIQQSLNQDKQYGGMPYGSGYGCGGSMMGNYGDPASTNASYNNTL